MTVIIDDAGSGDLLFGVVIGAYRSETQDFKYDVIDVQYFQPPQFGKKEYLTQASNIVLSLLTKLELKSDEPIMICRSYIFDVAVENLIQKYGADRISRVKVTGEPQCFTETAYLDEIRNLGYNMEVATTIQSALKAVHCTVIMVAHDEFRSLTPADLAAYIGGSAAIIDGPGIFTPMDVKRVGLVYRGIGRGVIQ